MGNFCHNQPSTSETEFQVEMTDVDNRLIGGHLEIHQSSLQFVSQDGLTEKLWPLKCLKRFGTEKDVFVIECGRRCQGGVGIFAFK